MFRIQGISMQDKERTQYALSRLYGLGMKTAADVLDGLKINLAKRVKELSEDEVKNITAALEKVKLEGDLREDLQENIKRHKSISSYRGMRHIRGLPCRGQRTKSNARTKKGKKQTVGAFTKEYWAKLETQKNSKK
jgi:small subunit ribosomal protein S13